MHSFRRGPIAGVRAAWRDGLLRYVRRTHSEQPGREREREKERNFSAAWIPPSFVRSRWSGVGRERPRGREGGRVVLVRQAGTVDGWTGRNAA